MIVVVKPSSVTGPVFPGLKLPFTLGKPAKPQRWVLAWVIGWLLCGCASSSVAKLEPEYRLPPGVAPPSGYVSLQPEQSLERLADMLDKVAIERSAAVQEVRAATARLLAQRYDRLPQLRPTGSISLDGDLDGGNNASFGLVLEQVIWDAGRTRARTDDASLGVAEAVVRAWAARNEEVSDGLEAYIDMARYQARRRAYSDLETNFVELAELLELRASGGVADRGEGLRMKLARQKLRRNVVADTAALNEARSELTRVLSSDIDFDSDVPRLPSLSHAVKQCERAWPNSETPEDALARLAVGVAQKNKELTAARRFPRLVLGAGAEFENATSDVNTGVNLSLDASDLLGFGGRRVVEAAELDTQAALAAYKAQKQDTNAELAQLEANYSELQGGLGQLQYMQRANREAVTLYSEQLDAGSIPIAEGIALYEEVAQTEVDIIDFRADMVLNCLASSKQRGLLAPFFDDSAMTTTQVSSSDE